MVLIGVGTVLKQWANDGFMTIPRRGLQRKANSIGPIWICLILEQETHDSFMSTMRRNS